MTNGTRGEGMEEGMGEANALFEWVGLDGSVAVPSY